MSTDRPASLRARWVFPVEGEPIANGVVRLEGNRIADVTNGKSRGVDLDLGEVALIPGFVNAHTHLDLSPLFELPTSVPVDQVEWLRAMIAARRANAAADTTRVIQANIQASLDAGTTTLADISSDGASWKELRNSPLRGAVYHEMLGLSRARAMETCTRAFEWLKRSKVDTESSAQRLRGGLSPHAPYSTVGWLYERAASAGVPLSTHLAELPEESELLRHGTGRLPALLRDLGAWDEDWSALGSRSADYVRRGALKQSDWLIAHGTYLEEMDFWQLRPEAAPSGQRVAVVYCPRSTAYFGHGPHPFKAMLERGAVVCLGTDSLASSPSLSMLDEMRFLKENDPTLPGNLLLTMATLSGAWALRMEDQVGSLLPEKLADMAVVRIPTTDRFDDPHDVLLSSEAEVIATMLGGQIVAGRSRRPGV